MSEHLLGVMVGALTTLVVNTIGFVSLSRKLDGKVDKKDHDELTGRVVVLEEKSA